MKTPVHFLVVVLLLVAGLAFSGSVFAQDTNKNPLLEESWDMLRIAGSKVGYVHTRSRSIEAPEPVIETTVLSRMTLKRMGAAITMNNTTVFREKPDGSLISAHAMTDMSSIQTITDAVVKNDQIEVSTQTLGQNHTTEIPWDPSILGPYAQDLLLRKMELKPGTTVTFKMFEPELQKIVTTTATLGKQEEIDIFGVPQTLWRGTMEQDILPGIVTTVWLDDGGGVIRSLTPILGGVETLRVTREQALSADEAPSVDIMLSLAITPNRAITNPYQTREILFRIEGDVKALKHLALADRRQTIEKELPDAVLLRIRAVGDAAEPLAEKPGPAYLKSSPYIQASDPEIIKLAHLAVGDAQTPWEKAKRLERWVFKNIHKKNLGVGFASAKEVAQTREGDCTEHAVLLAALLRAEGIPSRVAVGVVYWNGIFGYHMWTEAFLNDWTALDATLAKDLVDATHIRFAESALETGTVSGAMLSVVPLLGKIKITVEEVKH